MILSIKKRDGRVVPFDQNKIEQAIEKSFMASGSQKTQETAAELAALVVESRDEGEVEAGWRALQQQLARLGLPAVEQGMTARLADALPRYHEAGYYQEIQP